MFSLTKAGVAAGDIKVIVTMLFIIAVFSTFISFMLSVANALGIYEMTKTLGIKSKWFAFFPFFQSVALGKLADCAKGTPRTFFRRMLIILNVLYFALFLIGICAFLLGFVDTVFAADKILTNNGTIKASILSSLIAPGIILFAGAVVHLVYRIVYYIALFRIFSAFVPNSAVVYTVLSILFPFLAPIFLFFIRKNKPIFPRRDGYNYFTEG